MAALFAGMTVVLAVLGVVYNLLILVPAVLLAGVTYVFWSHGTGRMAARFYRRVEQRAASGTGGDQRRQRGRGQRVGTGARAGRGGFGAGPREEWTGPRSEQSAGQRGRRRQRQRRRRAPTGTDGPSRGEALQTLGLDPDADQDAIKAAYREKVKEVHPDTESGDEERFKEVNKAYERLTDD